jgi:hypothetical protein
VRADAEQIPPIKRLPFFSWTAFFAQSASNRRFTALRKISRPRLPREFQILILRRNSMKGLALVGVVILVLGVLVFVVPFPHYHHHGVSLGDSHIGVTTEHDEKLPVAAGVVLLVVGAGLLIAGKSS